MIRARYAAPYPVDALLGRWHAAYDAIVEREGLALKPGVHELLDWLEGRAIPRAVATSTRRDRARAKLAQNGAPAALPGDRRRRRGRVRKAGAGHLHRGRAAARSERRHVRRARGFRARRAGRACRRHDADHGAGPASRRPRNWWRSISSCCPRCTMCSRISPHSRPEPFAGPPQGRRRPSSEGPRAARGSRCKTACDNRPNGLRSP